MLIVVSYPQTLVLSLVYLSRLKFQILVCSFEHFKGKKTFFNKPKLFLVFFKVFFAYSFYHQNPLFVSAGGVGFVGQWLFCFICYYFND